MKQTFKMLWILFVDYLYEILILILMLILCYFFYNFSELKFESRVSNIFSILALGFTAMNLRKTFSQRANIHLVRGLYLETLHIGDNIPLILYNSGNVLTFFKILKIQISDDKFKIEANCFNTEKIGDKEYSNQSFKILPKEGGDIHENLTFKIYVEFIFGQQQRIKKRKEQMFVKSEPILRGIQ